MNMLEMVCYDNDLNDDLRISTDNLTHGIEVLMISGISRQLQQGWEHSIKSSLVGDIMIIYEKDNESTQ